MNDFDALIMKLEFTKGIDQCSWFAHGKCKLEKDMIMTNTIIIFTVKFYNIKASGLIIE